MLFPSDFPAWSEFVVESVTFFTADEVRSSPAPNNAFSFKPTHTTFDKLPEAPECSQLLDNVKLKTQDLLCFTKDNNIHNIVVLRLNFESVLSFELIQVIWRSSQLWHDCADCWV